MDTHFEYLDILGKKWEKRKTYFNLLMAYIVKQAAVNEQLFDRRKLEIPLRDFARSGNAMEITNEMMKKINEETKESKKILQDLSNDIKKIHDLITPELTKIVHDIRDKRMTIVTELQKSLNAMKEVRKFFLESDYQKEMERLQEFITTSERLKKLISDGTMDAITDIAIKLAIKEE